MLFINNPTAKRVNYLSKKKSIVISIEETTQSFLVGGSNDIPATKTKGILGVVYVTFQMQVAKIVPVARTTVGFCGSI